jgi:glycopeptide antibiotics resistance protein
MSEMLYYLVGQVARIHHAIMQWNNSCETVLSDKQLHFIVMGLLGIALLFVIYPLFQALSKHHVLVIAWIYVFTVMVVVTFAIEIGQGITNTGNMDMEDIVYGLAGFMFLFIIFAVIRAVILGIAGLVKMALGLRDDEDDDE